jgi:hypothetical protein
MPMTTNEAGKLGGSSRSEAKRAASARNLALGRAKKLSSKQASDTDAPTATISDSPTDVEKQ